jgi:hypothetical protein
MRRGPSRASGRPHPEGRIHSRAKLPGPLPRPQLRRRRDAAHRARPEIQGHGSSHPHSRRSVRRLLPRGKTATLRESLQERCRAPDALPSTSHSDRGIDAQSKRRALAARLSRRGRTHSRPPAAFAPRETGEWWSLFSPIDFELDLIDQPPPLPPIFDLVMFAAPASKFSLWSRKGRRLEAWNDAGFARGHSRQTL